MEIYSTGNCSDLHRPMYREGRLKAGHFAVQFEQAQDLSTTENTNLRTARKHPNVTERATCCKHESLFRYPNLKFKYYPSLLPSTDDETVYRSGLHT